MKIYLPPSAAYFEPRSGPISAWQDHIPFGYDIVEAVKPKLLVELGTNKGVSYFTFCQSIKDHHIDALSYAVDTWQGDRHVTLTEAYNASTYQVVLQHNQTHYRGFSYLLKMRFAEALTSFAEESIDLLHIDGFHTYEAVLEDFYSWYPKVKPGGIILLHDITARVSPDFGVWKLWREISNQYDSFAFQHGYGLGVIRKDGPNHRSAPLLELLFHSSAEEQARLRAFYVHLSETIALKRQIQSLPFRKTINRLRSIRSTIQKRLSS